MSHTPIAQPEGKAFHGLELLRFLCALAIIVWHYQHFFLVDGAAIPGFDRSLQPLYGLFWLPYNWGNFAVEVFWGISGFIFFWKYADAIHDGRVGGGKFFSLRFSRLYPLHIATLALVAGLQWMYAQGHGGSFIYDYNDLRHLLLHLAFASDWGFHKGLSFNGPVWSVSLEVLAYAAFYVIARRWHFTGRSMAVIILTLVLAKILLPWIKDPVFCLLYFFVGGGAFLIIRQSQRHRHLLFAVTWVTTAMLIFWNWKTDGKVHTVLWVSITLFSLAAFVLLGERVTARKAKSAFSFLGGLTYSSYMIHFPLQLAAVTIGDRVGVGRDVYYLPLVFTGFLIATFALAAASYVWFERPMQQWLRRRMSGRRAQPGAP
ncbi:MAG TPA: acyltransferase [Magnetospirillum sp.]|nr:acyltransferase [Magnetospirillum sp.]